MPTQQAAAAQLAGPHRESQLLSAPVNRRRASGALGSTATRSAEAAGDRGGCEPASQRNASPVLVAEEGGEPGAEVRCRCRKSASLVRFRRGIEPLANRRTCAGVNQLGVAEHGGAGSQRFAAGGMGDICCRFFPRTCWRTKGHPPRSWFTPAQ